MRKLIVLLAVLAVIFAGCLKAPETAAPAAAAEESRMDQLYIEVSALGNLDYSTTIKWAWKW